MKTGDVVIMKSDGAFWNKGDKAQFISYNTQTGSGRADFTINDRYFGSGAWWIGTYDYAVESISEVIEL